MDVDEDEGQGAIDAFAAWSSLGQLDLEVATMLTIGILSLGFLT